MDFFLIIAGDLNNKGEKMKKTAVAALAVVLGATSANAGLLESLGLAKKTEPQTLAEACDTDEIKKICPDVIMGTESMTDCLIENVKSLSKQCATYIKKSVAEKAAAVKEEVASQKAVADEKSAADKAAAA